MNLIAGLCAADCARGADAVRPGIIATVGAGGFGAVPGDLDLDIYFHDSYFVVGHFHLMIGVVTMLGTFAAVYYWFPKLFGRTMNPTLGKIHFWCTFVPALRCSSSCTIRACRDSCGATRSPIYELAAAGRSLAQSISILAYIAAGTQLLFLFNFFSSLWRARRSATTPGKRPRSWRPVACSARQLRRAHTPVAHRDPYDYDPSREAGRDFAPQASA